MQVSDIEREAREKKAARTECARHEIVERLSNVLHKVFVHTAEIFPGVLSATSVEPDMKVSLMTLNDASHALEDSDVSALPRFGTAKQYSPD